MAKKGLLVLVLAASVAGGIFAQETAGTQWWLSGELSLVGGGLRAEYMVSDKLSLSLNAYWTTLIIFNELGTNVVARYYPWAGNFYLGLGLGYSWHTSTTTITSEELKTVVPQDSALQPLGNEIGLLSNEGLGIVPEIGWRVDVGAPGAFFLNPFVQLPITLGNRIAVPLFWDDVDRGFGASIGFRAGLGLGYTF